MTAFTVVVERAAKFARGRGCRLRVHVERSDRSTDRRLQSYYEDMRSVGHPFNRDNAAKYAPLSADSLRATLLEFRTKQKTSPLIQIADLCLWPRCTGGYAPDNRSFAALRTVGTLIDSPAARGCSRPPPPAAPP